MKNTYLSKTILGRYIKNAGIILSCLFVLGLGVNSTKAQTTVCAPLVTANSNGKVTFNFRNNNAFPVIITNISGMGTSTVSSNAEAWYRPSALAYPNAASFPALTVANWTQFGSNTVPVMSTVAPINLFGSLSLTVPAGATYGICISVCQTAVQTTGNLAYNTLVAGTTYTYSGGGCDILGGGPVATNASAAGGPRLASTLFANAPRGLRGCVTFIAAVPCSGTPAPGNTLSSTANACPGVNFNLSLQTATSGTGVTYQWKNSADNLTYFPISGATNSTLVTNQATATYYKCDVTCGSNTGTSNFLLVNMNAFTLPEAFSGGIVPPGCWVNGNPTYEVYSTASAYGVGVGSLMFNDFSANGINIDFTSPNFTPTTSGAVLSFDEAYATYSGENDQLQIMYSTNNGGTYTPLITYAGGSAGILNTGGTTTSVFVPTAGQWKPFSNISLPLGTTNIRFRNIAAFGNNMYIDNINIVVPPPCVGLPAPGNTTGPASACTGNLFTLGLQFPPTGAGLSYQWFTNPGAVPVSGATNSTYITSQSSTTTYYCEVFCLTSGLTGSSVPLTVTQNSFLTCYCTPTYTSGPFGDEITRVKLPGECTILDRSSGATISPYWDVVPVGTTTTTIKPGSSYQVEVTHGTDPNQYDAVWIDYNRDGVFDPSEEVNVAVIGNNAGSGGTNIIPFTVPGGASLGLTGMRVRGGNDSPLNNTQACGASSSGFGETEDYFVTIALGAVCSGAPVPGATNSTMTSNVCASSVFTLTTASSVCGSGIGYQWQVSTISATGPWTNISGATNASYAASQVVNSWYRLDADCSGIHGASTPSVAVTMGSILSCYCIPTYVNGNNAGDYINQVVLVGSSGTLNNSTGSQDFTALNYSYYTVPVGLNTVTVSLDKGSPYTIDIYSGTDGTNGYAAWIDYNVDGTFDPLTEYLGNTGVIGGNAVGQITFTVPSGAIGTTGVRLRIRGGDDGCNPSNVQACGASCSVWGEAEDYDITLVNLPPCVGTPTPGTAASTSVFVTPSSNFTLSTTGYSAAADLTFQWQSAPAAGGPWTNMSGATTGLYINSEIAATYYRCVVDCPLGGGSPTFAVTNTVFVNINPYCISSYTSGTSGGTLDYISRVRMEDWQGNTVLDNSSLGAVSAPYYTFFSGVAAPSFDAGGYFWLRANAGAYTGQILIQAWIDWNSDGDFVDAGEAINWANGGATNYGVALGGGVGSIANIYVEIPALGGGIAAGTKRVRVRYIDPVFNSPAIPAPYNNVAQDPCNSYTYGETEDYEINLINPGCSSPTVAANVQSFSPSITVVNDAVTMTMGPNIHGGLKKFQYSFTGFPTVSGQFVSYGSNTLTFIDNVQSPFLYIRAVYQAEGCAIDYSSVITIKLDCATPYTNLVFSGDYITNVTIKDGATPILNNTSTYDPTFDGYQNYLGIVTNVNRGYPYTMEITTAGALAEYRAVWVDVNVDGVLDASDLVYNSPTATVGTVTGIPFNLICSNQISDQVKCRVAISRNVIDDNPCFAGPYTFGEIEEYTLNLLQIPFLTVTPTNSVCQGQNATLNASGALSYAWTPVNGSGGVVMNPPAGLAATVTVSTTSPSNVFFTVTGTLANGCTAYNIVPVATTPQAGVVTPSASIICSGGTKLLTATGAAGNFEWQWSTDNITWSPAPGVNNNGLSYTTPATSLLYYYRLMSKSTLCYDISSNTSKIEIAATPTLNGAVTATNNSITLNWNPVGGGNYQVSCVGAPGSPFSLVIPPKTITGLNPNTNYTITVTQTSPATCIPAISPMTINQKTLCDIAPAPTFGATTNGSTVVNIPSGGPSYKVFYKFLTMFNNYLNSGATCLAPGSTYTITSQWSGVPVSVYLQACDCPTAGLMGQPGPAVIKYLLPGTSSCASPTGPGGVGLFTTGNVVSDCPNRIKVELGGSPTNNYRVTFQRLLPTFAAANTYPVSYSGIMSYTVMNTPLPQVWQVWVVSACGVGGTPPYSLLSEVVQVTVKSGCNKIENLVLSHPTCHGFTATWNVGDCGIPTTNLLGYSAFIKVGSSNWNGYAAPTNVKSGNIWGSGVTIQVYVRANSCNNSFGPASDIQTITTLSGAGCREEDQQVEESLNHDGITNEFGTLSVYPNPNQGQFVMDLQMGDLTSQDVRIDVMNMLGQVVFTQITNIVDGHITEGLALSENIASGNYMVRVMAGEKAVFNTRINISK